MKKIFNNRFLFITAISLITLISFTFLAIHLLNGNENTFIKSGYVINPLSEKVEKYFFEKDTEYKQNLSNKVAFKDASSKEVEVVQDSFLHYMDGSISFLKNGAILDIDSIKGDNPVLFYNITNESIISSNDLGYLIKTNSKDIKLNNFIGRISDDKYIVVGAAKASIPGVENLIEGDYFEIVYSAKGVVNIQNKDVKYQITAAGTKIYIGPVCIDLGDKKIIKQEKDIMSLTEITIDGDENIEIIPASKKEEENHQKESNSNHGNGTSNHENGTNNNENNGTGTNQGEGNIPEEVTKDIAVILKDATVASTNISVSFDIINANVDDNFILKVTNLDTGRIIDMRESVVSLEEEVINLLSPHTRYLFTVENEKDSYKYFQKIFETKDFKINLEKQYATSSSLSYKVNIDDDTDITNAKLSLYKFNEQTQKNEIVKTSYKDTDGTTKYVEKTVWLKDIQNTKEVTFDGLDSNTIYTAVMDEFSLQSSNFKDIYNITLTSMTLKKTPSFSAMEAKKNISNSSFKLSIGKILDEDKAITKYTYLIYKNADPSKPIIEPIEKNDASPIEVKIGDKEGQLKNDTNYFYKVIIEYFDNEKFVEYTTKDRINFVMGSDPYITVVPKEEQITYNSIGATIYLTDNNCLINMPNREGCTGPSSTEIVIKKNSPTGEVESISKLVDFTIENEEIKYDLYMDNLEEGTYYSIDVRAVLNNDEDNKPVEILHTDKSKQIILTKTLSSFSAIYPTEDKENSSANHVVNQRVKLEVDKNNTGSMTPEESAENIKKVVLTLYEGGHLEDITKQSPLTSPVIFTKSDTIDLKAMFYDDYYSITTDGTFGLDIDGLKKLSKTGKLSPEYTIMIKAYYDTSMEKEVKIANNIKVYSILETLLLENVVDPILSIKEITKGESGNLFDKLNDKGTIVGYRVNPVYDKNGLIANKLIPEKINIYVYDKDHKRVDFYVENSQNELKLVKEVSENIKDLAVGNYLKNIYIDYGTEYGSSDTIMTRGNSYYIGYELELASESGTRRYPSKKIEDSPSDYGIYEKVRCSKKEEPNIKMYIAKSSEDSITYRYEINDPDKALYKEETEQDYGFYYTINDEFIEKLKINLDKDNKYKGDITLKKLKNNDTYNLYYKLNLTKSDDISKDITSVADKRLFDGYYDANLPKYNLKYEIINNPLTDNKVIFKILATEEILDRISSYKVKFKDSLGHTLEKEFWKLDKCNESEEKCLIVDYIDLKNAGMKSIKDKENIIETSIEIIYDNGLTGYDFTIGKNKDYPYMIMQGNNTETEMGKYLVFNKQNKLVEWNSELDVGKGYYTYSFTNSNKTMMLYESLYDSKKDFINNIVVGNLGYSSRYGILNPKMMSKSTMKCEKNTFSFSSITPKVKVEETTGLINGAIEGLTLSGLEIEDIKNEGTAKEPKYYLYIDVWDNETDALNKNSNTIRPTVKVEINKDMPNGNKMNAVIDKLPSLKGDKKYYFNVYAYLLKNNNYQLIQLYDDGVNKGEYQTKTYSFNTKNGASLFNSKEIVYNTSEDNQDTYGTRILNTTIKLNKYQNNYPYNFSLLYVICNSNTCSKDDGYIFKKEISDISSEIKDKEDITGYDLEYGKDYFMHIYAKSLIFVKNSNGQYTEETQYTDLISSRDMKFKLSALREPSFTMTREANYEDGKYYIDLVINVKDPDETIKDGKYLVKLTDEKGNTKGNIQELNEDGIYVNIATGYEHKFDANVKNKKIRITDLEKDTKYIISASGTAYLNNYSETITKNDRTYEVSIKHSVYTPDDYGITFGHDISYVITDNSYIMLFRSATNFKNVTKVNYSVSLDSEAEQNVIVSGTDIIGEDHKFEFNEEYGYGQYVINRPTETGKNELGKYYLITVNFTVKKPHEENEVILGIEYNPKFSQSVAYVKADQQK